MKTARPLGGWASELLPGCRDDCRARTEGWSGWDRWQNCQWLEGWSQAIPEDGHGDNCESRCHAQCFRLLTRGSRSPHADCLYLYSCRSSLPFSGGSTTRMQRSDSRPQISQPGWLLWSSGVGKFNFSALWAWFCSRSSVKNIQRFEERSLTFLVWCRWICQSKIFVSWFLLYHNVSY